MPSIKPWTIGGSNLTADNCRLENNLKKVFLSKVTEAEGGHLSSNNLIFCSEFCDLIRLWKKVTLSDEPTALWVLISWSFVNKLQGKD